MAEAFPELGLEEPVSEKHISVLMLATRWSFDTYGVSTINKSLVNNLRLVDPEAKSIKITCAVLEEEGKIPENQVKDAEKYRVNLRGYVKPVGERGKPKVSWISKHVTAYYQHLLDTKYDFMIGHMPFLADGCLNLTQNIKYNRGHVSKVILIAQDVSRDPDGETDEDCMKIWLNAADVVFSVGQAMRMTIQSIIEAHSLSTEHKLYLPSFPLDFFRIEQPSNRRSFLGAQNILMMTTEIENVEVPGLDFELATVSATEASKNIMFNEGSVLERQISFTLQLIGAKGEEKSLWEEKFEAVKQKHNIESRFPSFKLLAFQNVEKLVPTLKRAAIMILPLHPESPLFGTEALVAMAAGVPILVSRNSGIAAFLQSIGLEEPIVRDNEGFKKGAEEWKKRLIQKITNVEESQNIARELRKILLLDTSIAATHLDFINSVTREACVQAKVELSTDSVVTDEHLQTAKQFGIQLDDHQSTDAKKFIIVFLQKLFLQNEKLQQGLLTKELKPSIAKLFKEVITTLEETERKLVDIQSGSLILTLFCSTPASKQQLQDEEWISRVKAQLEELLKSMDLKVKVRVQAPEIRRRTTELLPALRQLKLRHKEQYDESSSGFETLTTSDSDILSQMFGNVKVSEWLERQTEFTPHEAMGAESSGLELLETIPIDYFTGAWAHHAVTRFAVSDSGSIAVASPYLEPSLSTVHRNAGKPPTVLSNTKSYYSTVFLKKPGEDKEYLAAHCLDDMSIHLWDVENKTSRVVYKMNTDQQDLMNLCLIDERTVAYGEFLPSRGACSIYILNTESEPWSLRNTMRVEGVKCILDMCYTEIDGAPCLFLFCYTDQTIQAVEMVGGRIRWSIGKEEMGETFSPLSICTDTSGASLLIADLGKHAIHQVEAETAVVTRSIGLFQTHGWDRPFCVRTKDEFIYVGCFKEDPPKDTPKPVIAKFRKSQEL